MTFSTVAVVGASGSLGAPIVQALLAAGFKVTAITRETSTSTFPDRVEVRRAKLTSVESLTAAFTGLDVVIITVTTTESDNQTPFADAAIAAGVKRFIPAEWGHNTRPGKLSGPLVQMLAGKTKTTDYLIEKTKVHPELTWTGIATSPFLDWGLDHGVFGINLPTKTATIFDSGNEPGSASTLPFVAQAVVAVLKREEQTANKYYHVAEHTVTQNQLLRLFEEETGVKFAVTNTSTKDIAKVRDEKIARGDWSAFFEALLVYGFADGEGKVVKEGDAGNKELGLEGRELREVVREFVRTRSG
ncbi:hypothetical protein N0V88_006707 [Collariella sp. IMI 366227]|nr:hypothetical protein N0V88_006707 [Collariella sp. IMI 366227]